MKSICIKIVNQKTAKYLLEKLEAFDLDKTFYSFKKFKLYQNIIIHYLGNSEEEFFIKLSETLSSLIIELYEDYIIQNLIKVEYFYFDNIEKNKIKETTLEDLYNNEETICEYEKRFELIKNSFYDYLVSNHSMVLQGFVTFRLQDYFEILLEQIDKSVNKYIIQKEYTEFISILKMYINSEPSTCNLVHLIYKNSKPILLDENKDIIKIEDNILNAKYLSDITFSSNDYILNTLLGLVPKKIYIHLLDEKCDEFINTLKLIFENRVFICTDCTICNIYNKSNIAKP